MSALFSLFSFLAKLLSPLAMPALAWLIGRSSGKKAAQLDAAQKATSVEAAMAQAEMTRPADKKSVIEMFNKGTF